MRRDDPTSSLHTELTSGVSTCSEVRSSEVPCEPYGVATLLSVVAWCDKRKKIRMSESSSLCATCVQAGIVMGAINVLPDAVADSAADQHVRKEVVAPGEARHTHRRGQSVSANLHQALISVFVCHDSR